MITSFNRATAVFSTLVLAAIGGCELPTIPLARLETSEPIGTTYWGEPSNGLRAGIAIKAPGGGEDEKVLVGQVGAPGVKLWCTLKNESDHPIRIIHPFRPHLNNSAVVWMSPDSRTAWPDTYWAPKRSKQVYEVPPGGQLALEYEYRPDASTSTPYTRTLRFEYDNYASTAVLAENERVEKVDGFWTGHVMSGILPVTVK